VAVPPSVLVKDASGNPVQGVAITFAEAGGGGSITGANQITNASGIATVGSWTLGMTAGTNTLTATAPGLTGSPVTFTATGAPGAPAHLTMFSGDGLTGEVGTTLGTPHTVLVTDANSNPVPNVTVSWAAASGGGSVNPAITTSNTSGIASTSWTLGTRMTPTDSTQVVQATGVGSPVNFTGFTIPGPVSASQTTVVASPATITASTGSSASTITVTARDQYGNVIRGKTVVLAATGT